MKPKRRWNERTRLILTLELAVVLPAATLIVVSVLHLKSFQRDRAVEALIQRDFTHVLAITEKHMSQRAVELVDDVRSQLPGPGNTCAVTLDKILLAHPYVAHVFLYDPQHGMVFRSQSDRLQDPSFQAEAESIAKIGEGWLKIEFADLVKKFADRESKGAGPYMFEYNWAPRGDKHVYQNYALFMKKDDETGSKAIAGVVFEVSPIPESVFVRHSAPI